MWWPFPVHDFPRRELVAQGRDRPDDPARFRLTSFETRQGVDASPGAVSGGLAHEKQHARLLFDNRKPRDGSAPSLSPRSTQHDNQLAAPGYNVSAVLQQDEAGPIFTPANTVGGYAKRVVVV
ncbi:MULTISPECIES: hypothetical protein [Paraburkholderia]|uniref:Uncharacterized protein n=1 Tax=Paraburkholderia podalyriae TaxID=1938811 RepID=A0ABR7Q0T4_9BURK|nr:hypothetical protein [Paraburkholderia podalyriae]MBC8752142.1 hypothetical protein [Paraburkholderia podalyriae]